VVDWFRVSERILLVLAIVLPLATSCATSRADATMTATAPGVEPSADTSSGARSEPASPSPVPRAPPVECEARVGANKLRRPAVKRTVDAGLGRWLQTVAIDPLLSHGHFQGWIIRSLDAGDACYAGIDLRSGDVVTRINGRSVERPEDALEVWVALSRPPPHWFVSG
jgi:hypothetical protein